MKKKIKDLTKKEAIAICGECECKNCPLKLRSNVGDICFKAVIIQNEDILEREINLVE